MSFMIWNPGEADMPTQTVPVTIVSGFLGAGKTSVLNRILADPSSQKTAVLVNDLGEVNIDATLIKGAVKEADGAIAGMLELQGGCICCSIQTKLLDALLELYQRFEPQHIVIEATGVAEPRAILGSLRSRNFHGMRGSDFLNVANLITVIDGGNLEQYFASAEDAGGSKRAHMLMSDPRRPMQELLMEQIECADILLINKVDELPDATAKQRLQSHLHALNRHAEVWTSSFGEIDVEKLMSKRRFLADETPIGASWRKAIIGNKDRSHLSWKKVEAPRRMIASSIPLHARNGSPSSDRDEPEGDASHHKDYGLETFIFNARVQFQESKLMKVLRTRLPGVIRAKGFYWTDAAPERVGVLSIAGRMLRADYSSDWKGLKIQRRESDEGGAEKGDRVPPPPGSDGPRQELVFIGIELDGELIEKTLSDCFVQEEARR